jgi:hypothetical protein
MQGPPSIFGANATCESVIPLAQLSELAGGTMELEPSYSDLSGYDFDIAILGGINCYWHAVDGEAGGANVALAVLPAKGLLPATPDEQKCTTTKGDDYSSASCSASFSVDGYWATWVWGESPKGTAKKVSTKSTALKTALRTRMKTQGPAAAYTPPAGSWPANPDCAAIAKETSLLTALSEPKWKLVDRGPTGMSFTAPSVVAAITHHTRQGCRWGKEANDWPSFDFQLYPAGAWYASVVTALPGMTEISISGATYALRQTDDTGKVSSIEVFDGVNWLRMWCSSEEEYAQDLALIPGILAELDASA